MLFKRAGGALRVLLAHPGGPFWARKDAGAWSIPKGEYEPGEDARAAALREFEEETGRAPPSGALIALGEARQAGGKVVSAWACEGDFDPTQAASNTFEMTWPPKSGRTATFPEIDRVAWFTLEEAATKILAGQRPFLERLAEALK